MLKLVSIVGARPQFVKLTPICRVIDAHNNRCARASRIHQIIVHTGQHYDYAMDKVFFEELHLPKADYNLGVGSASHGRQTALMLERIEKVLKKEKPQIVVVYGDTNSTLAGALAAAKLNLPVAHIEAGLRSFNKSMPEEVNRILTDHVSRLLFCPTEVAVKNLTTEGIKKGVFKVGDVMLDVSQFYLKIAEQKSSILNKLMIRPKEYSLCTIHRQENTDNPKRLKSIFEALNKLAKEENIIVFPVHPRTKKMIRLLKIGSSYDNFRIISPVSYLEMLILEKNAKAILTDSGGVQKEAFFFNVPCITLRDETEWLETVSYKQNILVGADKEKIIRAFRKRVYPAKSKVKLYGEGKAGEKIVKEIFTFLTNKRKSKCQR